LSYQHADVGEFAVKSDAMFEQNLHEHESDMKSLRFKQAQAMLDLFEADCGRAALTLDEIKEWASAQQNDQLLLRVQSLISQSSS
jgi:hypothetical protein